MKVFAAGALGAAIIALAASGYFFFIQTPAPPLPLGEEVPSSALTAARTAPQGMQEYNDGQYKFSLLYLESLQVSSVDEGGGASTITFQNPTAGQGFQVFVVPFFESQISDERFLRDIPTGVRDNAEDITVDGAQGVAFYSKDIMLGDTREVWFIKNNYLYEVTTLRPLEADLLEVLKTWTFLE